MGASFIMPWFWILFAVAVCIAVGVASGYLPAVRAAALDPIVALLWSVERICQAKDIGGGLCPTENVLPFTRRQTQDWISLGPCSTSASVLISSLLPSVPRVSLFP